MLFLTWHGTVVYLPAGAALPVQEPILAAPPGAALFAIDGAELKPGARIGHATLGILDLEAAEPAGALHVRRDRQYLCADPKRPGMFFDRSAALAWETFLPLSAAELADLRYILQNRWVVRQSGRVISRGALSLADGFKLRIGPFTLDLARRRPVPLGDRPVTDIELPLAPYEPPEGFRLSEGYMPPVDIFVAEDAPPPDPPGRMDETAATALLTALHRRVHGEEPPAEKLAHAVSLLAENPVASVIDEVLGDVTGWLPRPVPAQATVREGRTLVFCTAYAPSPVVWQARYRRWIAAIQASALGADQLLLVDDGSDSLPAWSNTSVHGVESAADAGLIRTSAPVVLQHFRERMGRWTTENFPGWHRSFVFGAAYAAAHGFERVMHIESDAFLISARVQEYFRTAPDGWTALWSEKYDFPEIALQVAFGSGVARLAEFAAKPYEGLIERTHEWALPFTDIARNFIGDRYGERSDPIPRDADFATQVPASREPEYYWWLNAEAASGAGPVSPSLELVFGLEGGTTPDPTDGWSRAEPKQCWMVGPRSELRLPPLHAPYGMTLRLDGFPHVQGQTLPLQRLELKWNNEIIGAFEIARGGVFDCLVPAHCIYPRAQNRLTLLHPDAASPYDLAGILDKRVLAIALRRLTLTPHRAP